MKEEWRDVVGYEGRYCVSNTGKILSKINKSGEIERKLQTDKDGYKTFSVAFKGKNKVLKVHRVVAEAFIQNKENKNTVNHKDQNKSNNNAYNLEWMTSAENSRYSFSKKICQYEISGKLVKIWDAMRDAERAGFHRRHISECCNGINKTHSGYKWGYYE